MNNYVDRWSRYHDKPRLDGNHIPSNNGFIYTAYAEKANLPIDYLMLEMCFMKCKTANSELPNGIALLRSPNQLTPPISRDEVLGMAALGFLKPRHLNGWNFSPFPIPRFNPLKTISQFLELRGKHRNYMWLNNMSHTYRFAFSVPLTDRHFILKCWGKFNPIYWLIAKIDSKFSKPKNGIHWLKYGGEDRKIIMQQEFPEDHPLRNV
jgi:hypothetical protein